MREKVKRRGCCSHHLRGPLVCLSPWGSTGRMSPCDTPCWLWVPSRTPLPSRHRFLPSHVVLLAQLSWAVGSRAGWPHRAHLCPAPALGAPHRHPGPPPGDATGAECVSQCDCPQPQGCHWCGGAAVPMPVPVCPHHRAQTNLPVLHLPPLLTGMALLRGSGARADPESSEESSVSPAGHRGAPTG